MRKYFIFILLLFLSFSSCTSKAKDSENRTQIRFETNKGTIVVALYNETPLHRDNFVKLTKQKFFDGTLFHRVIDNFMIQGGDPDSKNAKSGVALGNGGPGYRIPAEIREGIFHKKGVLAAARTGDNINPKRESSGSQFYLTEGKVFTKEQLKSMENKKNAKLRKQLIQSFKQQYKTSIDSAVNLKRTTGDTISLQNLLTKLNKEIDAIVAEKGFNFSEAQIQAYTTVGGVPHLDGAYTVFGEVVEGQEVIDKIAEVETDKRDRPIEDVIIVKASVVK